MKDWHTLVTNVNASKILLKLNEMPSNNFNLCKKIRLSEPTVSYWIGHLLKLNLIVLNYFNYRNEKIWRIDNSFDEKSNPADLMKEDGKPPMDALKLKILRFTYYFCSYMLEQKVFDEAKKGIKKEYSFLDKPLNKEVFLQ